MNQAISIAEAEAHFADVIKSAEHAGPVVVTRYGTPVAVVLKIADYEDLLHAREGARGGGLASLAGGWPGSEEYADILDEIQRNRTMPRPLPELLDED